MTRPCFLVVDRDQPGSISTRKLVIETAKVNVITAYSGAEALEMVAHFPAVDGVVIDVGLADIPCNELVSRFKAAGVTVPIVAVGTPTRKVCEGADHFVDSFDPSKLLELLRSLMPKIDRMLADEDAKIS